MSDLVERLRDTELEPQYNNYESPKDWAVMCRIYWKDRAAEAADEIGALRAQAERLGAELKELKRQRSGLQDELNIRRRKQVKIDKTKELNAALMGYHETIREENYWSCHHYCDRLGPHHENCLVHKVDALLKSQEAGS